MYADPYHLGFSFKKRFRRFRPFKAIKRAVTFKPKSFSLKNIMGAVGSVTTTVATGGIAPILAPKLVSAHSKTMRTVGMATTAVAAAAGAWAAAPVAMSGLVSKLGTAAAFLGKGLVQGAGGLLFQRGSQGEPIGSGMTAEQTFPRFMAWFRSLPPAGQQIIANIASPGAIAEFERTGRIPVEWQQALGVPPPPTGTAYVTPGTAGSVNLGGVGLGGVGDLAQVPVWIWALGAGVVGIAVLSYREAGRR